MKFNMGNVDRIARLAVASLIAILFFAGTVSGTLAVVLWVVAAIFLLTGLVGTCPIYSILGLSTKPNAEDSV